jgi:hypothetical protein
MKKYTLTISIIFVHLYTYTSEPAARQKITWHESAQAIYTNLKQQLNTLQSLKQTLKKRNCIKIESILNNIENKTNQETVINFAQATKSPKHLQILYKTYKELKHVYALNLFYSGTQYEYKPKQRSEQVILKNLSRRNGFIRSRLQNKRYFNQEEIELIESLQIHQNDTQALTFLYKKHNELRHHHKNEIELMSLLEEYERLKLIDENGKKFSKILEEKIIDLEKILIEPEKISKRKNPKIFSQIIQEYRECAVTPQVPDHELEQSMFDSNKKGAVLDKNLFFI